jgi:hypothetical protein
VYDASSSRLGSLRQPNLHRDIQRPERGVIQINPQTNQSKTRTRDLKGTASTGEFTRAILNALETVQVESDTT